MPYINIELDQYSLSATMNSRAQNVEKYIYIKLLNNVYMCFKLYFNNHIYFIVFICKDRYCVINTLESLSIFISRNNSLEKFSIYNYVKLRRQLWSFFSWNKINFTMISYRAWYIYMCVCIYTYIYIHTFIFSQTYFQVNYISIFYHLCFTRAKTKM